MADPFKEMKDRLVELLTPRELDQCTSILLGQRSAAEGPQS